MCKEIGDTVTITMPEGYFEDKTRRSVDIDRCIVKQIQALWDAGFNTEACCCGHGKVDPNVIVAEGYEADEISKIVDVLNRCGLRRWSVLQWKLQEVAASKGRKRCDICKFAGEVHAIPVPAGTTFAVECCVEGGQHPFVRRGADCLFPDKFRSYES